jgi:hypothetical protein
MPLKQALLTAVPRERTVGPGPQGHRFAAAHPRLSRALGDSGSPVRQPNLHLARAVRGSDDPAQAIRAARASARRRGRPPGARLPPGGGRGDHHRRRLGVLPTPTCCRSWRPSTSRRRSTHDLVFRAASFRSWGSPSIICGPPRAGPTSIAVAKTAQIEALPIDQRLDALRRFGAEAGRRRSLAFAQAVPHHVARRARRGQPPRPRHPAPHPPPYRREPENRHAGEGGDRESRIPPLGGRRVSLRAFLLSQRHHP